jgi:hypothetical protein
MAVTAVYIEGEQPHPPRKYAVWLHRGSGLRLAPHPSAPHLCDLPAVRRWVRTAHRPTAISYREGVLPTRALRERA